MTHGSDIQNVAAKARDAANRGDWTTAERLWREVRALDPSNPQAAFSLGVHAMRGGDFATAKVFMEEACASSPKDMLAWLTLGVVRRSLGDAPGELAAIDAALSIDSNFLPGLLAKAAWFERQGSHANAAIFFQTALKLAPPLPHWPENLRPQLMHARDVANAFAADMERKLDEAAGALLADLPPMARARWREAAAIMAGRTQPYTSQCNQLHVPRLPAEPFFDTAQFPWVAALEAQTDAIRAELQAALERDRKQFTPYVAYKPGAPVNQWQDLNHSDRWSAYQLWRGGHPAREHLDHCPVTAKALEAVGMAEIGGLCPNAMFSALAPRTHIPPHTGETNARVVAHLPLIVPDGCLYRVGFEQRRWEVGKVLIFDDTIEHEARNDSDELRVVLIFDIWNPHLAAPEREVVRTMMRTAREITGAEAGGSA